MTVVDRIEINPNVMMGKPVIRGTRIPVELILRKISEGASEGDLIDAFPGSPMKIFRLRFDTVVGGGMNEIIPGYLRNRCGVG